MGVVGGWRPPSRPTREDVEAAKTEGGGWTRQQLAAWGVPWPPPKGWLKELTKDDDAEEG